MSHAFALCLTRLPDSLKNSLVDHVPHLEQKLNIFAEENKALLHWMREPARNTVSGRATVSGTTSAARTTARPVFEAGDNLVDPNRVLLPDDMLNLEEYESSVTPLACTSPRSAQDAFMLSRVNVMFSSSYEPPAFLLRAVAECKATLNDAVIVAATADERLFLVNRGNEAVQVGPGELFGFGLGAFEEKAVSALRAILGSVLIWFNLVHMAS